MATAITLPINISFSAIPSFFKRRVERKFPANKAAACHTLTTAQASTNCFFSIFASREPLHSMPAKISSDMPSRISRFSGQSISYILYSLSAFIASVLIMNFTLETVSSAFPPKDSYSHPASIMAWIRSTSSFTSPL